MSLTVLYDADCDFCRHSAHVLRTLDSRRRLRIRPLQEFVPAGGADPSTAALREALHVRADDGSWWSGGRAMVRIAEEIPLLAPLAVGGRVPGADGLVDAAYRFVAQHRGAISSLLGLGGCRFDPT